MIRDEVRQWLLEADIDELEGRGESPIARLVREDVAVRGLAARIRSSMRDADAGLATFSTAVVAARKRNPFAGRQLPTRRRLLRVVPALAAAVLAVIWIARPDLPPAPEAPASDQPMTARLAAASTRPLAVFATDNPDIAIVWLLDAEEEK